MLVKLFIPLLIIITGHAQINFSSENQLIIQDSNNQRINYLKVNPEVKNSKACQEFLDYAQNKMNTTGLIVIKNSEAEIEMYGQGANKKTKNRMWSVSKFLTGLMLGVQVTEHGMELLDKSLTEFGIDRTPLKSDKYPYWQDVTVRSVWNFSSGINWCEYGNCRAVDGASLLYGKGNQDALKYVLSQPLTHQPGTYYRYSAGNFILLQSVFRSQFDDYTDYINSPYETVLKRLNIAREDYSFEVDGKGLIMGGSGLSLTTRGMAKLGQLLLNDGIWYDDRLLTKEFLKEMTTVSSAIKNSSFSIQNWEGPAGGAIWLNDDSKNGDGLDRDGVPAFMPTSPRDMIYAGGNFGQFLLVYPSSNLVVARTGGDAGHFVHWKPFSEKALKCFAPDQLREDVKPKEEKTPPDTGKNLGLKRIMDEHILSNARAHEVCSCVFVSGHKNLATCDLLVPTKQTLFSFVNTHNIVGKPKINFKNHQVTVKTKLGFYQAISEFDPQKPHLGCQLKKENDAIKLWQWVPKK